MGLDGCCAVCLGSIVVEDAGVLLVSVTTSSSSSIGGRCARSLAWKRRALLSLTPSVFLASGPRTGMDGLSLPV